MRTLFVSAVVALIAMPVSAAQFYIVQDIQKQTCRISQEPPKDDDKFALVGDGAYGYEGTAAADMRKIESCNPRDASAATPRAPTGLKAD